MTTTEFLRAAWELDLFSLVLFAGVAAVYCGFHLRRKQGVTLRRLLCFATAFGILVLALASPMRLLAGRYLFSAHMLQHLLLLLVIPPVFLMALPRIGGTDQFRAFSGRTAFGWSAGVGAMLVWHVPLLCNAAGTEPFWFRFQIVSLLVCGVLFWRPIVGPRTNQRLAPLTGMAYLFAACLACTLLGIYITFAPVTVCSVYAHPADALGILPLIRERWGMTPLVDQKLGGLMMWVPACLIYLTGILGLLARWYENDSAREETFTRGEPAQASKLHYE